MGFNSGFKGLINGKTSGANSHRLENLWLKVSSEEHQNLWLKVSSEEHQNLWLQVSSEEHQNLWLKVSSEEHQNLWLKVSSEEHQNILQYYNLLFKTFYFIFKEQPTRCNVSSIYLFLNIALHVSGGSSSHHQENKIVHIASGTVKPVLLPAAVVDEIELLFISSM